MIAIPPRIEQILAGAPDVSAAVKKTVVDFDSWISKSPLTFFPEYTDHGPEHINSVLATAEQLVTAESLDILTPQDAGALIVAVVLHDCAMHFTNDGFRRLVSGATGLVPVAELGDGAWPALWEAYLAEAVRFPPAQNNRLFGDPSPVRPPPLDDWNWNKKQDLMAGEFLRRHHARLAHQIALEGFPGAKDEVIRLDSGFSRHTRDVIGMIARSHGMSLRPCLDYLEQVHEDRIEPERIRALFLMVVLRIADYLQIEAGRAPVTRIRMQAIRSTLSIHEWKKHHAVPQITIDEKDPQALKCIVRAEETDSIATYLSLLRLTRDIQRELDSSWAILGEVYGRLTDSARPLARLALTIRRLRTNLENPTFLKKLKFQPESVSFQSADARLFELLIEPLYGPNTDAGVRELVQNGVDAVRELQAYCRRHGLKPDILPRPKQDADVSVSLEEIGGERRVVVRDRGIGMTLEIVRDYFLKVGASYRNSAAWKHEFTNADQQSTILRTGYFGVGALAAFLLGDEVRVLTRHVTAGEGLEFTASLQTEVIQVNRVTDCPIGTTVTVPLRQELAVKLWVPNLRYFLAQPSVEVQGELPKVTHPDIDDPATPEWQRLEASKQPVVFWRRGGSFVDRVIHNGFMIEHGDQQLRELWTDKWYGLRILLPPLHILDREGNQAKPYLDLARTEFRQDRFGPLDQIFVDVLRDYLAFLLVTTPGKAGDIYLFKQQDYRYVECAAGDRNMGFQRNQFRCLPVVYTRNGIAPLDAHVLEKLGISSLFLVKGGSIFSLLEIDSSFGVLLVEGPKSEDGLLMYPREGIATPPARLNVTGSAAYDMDVFRGKNRNVTPRGKPKPLNKRATETLQAMLHEIVHAKVGPGVAIVWTLGSPDKDVECTVMETIARTLSGASETGESPLVLAWRKFLGDGIIPYDLSVRKAQMGKAFEQLEPYVAAWRKLYVEPPRWPT